MVLPEESSVCLPGYQMISCFSRTGSVHGGSCIFYKGEYSCVRRDDLKNKGQEINLECSCVEIAELKLIIICIYRTGNGNLNKFFKLLEDILHSSNTVKYNVLICGDLNVDLLLKDVSTARLLDLMNYFNMRQTIFEPTRITNHSKTLIDNIFVNLYYEYSRNIHLNVSDHEAQQISFSVQCVSECEKRFFKHRLTAEDRLYLVAKEIEGLNLVNEISALGEVDAAFEHFWMAYCFYLTCIALKRRWLDARLRVVDLG